MEITGANQVNAASSGKDRSTIVSDYDTFLRLLTTQMQNQDPLNPIDSSDYAVQIATFSGVEQQTLTNQILAQLQGQFGQMSFGQMAGWVGKEVRAEMPVQILNGAAVNLHILPSAGADRCVLAVRDAQGALVNRIDLSADEGDLIWTPADISGAPLPDGAYEMTLESYIGEQPIATTPVSSYARVTEVQIEAGGIWLVMAGGFRIPATSATGLRG